MRDTWNLKPSEGASDKAALVWSKRWIYDGNLQNCKLFFPAVLLLVYDAKLGISRFQPGS